MKTRSVQILSLQARQGVPSSLDRGLVCGCVGWHDGSAGLPRRGFAPATTRAAAMPTFHRTRGRLVARAVGYGIGEDVSARVFTSTGSRRGWRWHRGRPRRRLSRESIVVEQQVGHS
jgi:hypothetical protein